MNLPESAQHAEEMADPARSNGKGRRRVRVVAAILASSLILLILAAAQFLGHKLRARETITTMAKLSTVLHSHQPSSLSKEDLERLLKEAEVESVKLNDGWGRPLLLGVAREDPGGRFVYSVRSLGRDGEEGTCCLGWIEDIDQDAVLEGGDWKQVWK